MGRLVAQGRIRINGLEDFNHGNQIVLMQGSLNTRPLPSTALAPLRVSHLYLKIDYPTPVDKDLDGQYNNSNTFKVGKHNKLYGADVVKSNISAYMKKQAEKQNYMSADMQGLVQKLSDTLLGPHASQDTMNRHDGRTQHRPHRPDGGSTQRDRPHLTEGMQDALNTVTALTRKDVVPAGENTLQSDGARALDTVDQLTGDATHEDLITEQVLDPNLRNTGAVPRTQVMLSFFFSILTVSNPNLISFTIQRPFQPNLLQNN